MEKGIVLVCDLYGEPIRLDVCGRLDKDNDGKNVGVEYELRVEDEEANVEASLWLDKSGNFLRQDEPASPRIAAVFAHGTLSTNASTGWAKT